MVAISNKYKFVFLKSRKTAGTSIERALFPFCTKLDDDLPLELSDSHYGEGVARGPAPEGWRPHIPAARVRRRLGQEKWDSYFRFTAVRNPFDRVVSHFFWLRREDEIIQSDSFDDIRTAFRRFCVRPRYATDADIVMIDDKFVAQDAIRYECLADDLARMAQKLGFEEAVDPLPEFNKGIRKWGDVPVAEFYDDASIEAVKRAMGWVFDNFDYSEDPRDTRIPELKT
ncbi:sulfotransferase family 2 domain-containing protein [Ruegeria meonggei]|uniref:sulfotransferase family 2 domain-containing protein n=1 Tax=Ruegeria meonggei TaxID=1446476 RepID=UPI003671F377